MANEPTGASSPESQPERNADKPRNTNPPVSDASPASRDGQTAHSDVKDNKVVAQDATTASSPKTSGIQIQPASDIVARTEGDAVALTGDSKPCPTDAEGRLVEGEASKTPTTTEGTDDYHSSDHGYGEDNPYHQETTDYHHDDYHHDDYHHQDPHHDDPYHHQSDDHGSGGWVPPSGGTDSSSETPDEEEEGGGPIKGFLDHLEDLRWLLIKCICSVLVAMVVCLIAGDKIIAILKYPLDQANNMRMAGDEQPSRLRIQMGTNEWYIPWTTNQSFGPLPLGTNAIKSVVIVPVQIGTNVLLALQPDPNSQEVEHKFQKLTVFDPMEPFTLILDIALWGGLGLASPFVFFFIAQFVLPALRKKEKKWLGQGVAIGAGLFIGGVVFCYFLIMKVTFYATTGFAEWMGFKVEMWQASKYISFTIKFLVGMGLSFELPVVLLTLVKVGILSYQRLAAMRPYMVIILMTVAGFITPSGDPFSMVLMAAPLYVLYEASIIVAWIWHRRELREQAALEKAEREGR